METTTTAPEQPQKTVEARFREVLDFDQNIASLIYTGLMMQGIVPESDKAKAFWSAFNVNELWSRVWTAIQTKYTQEKIEEYIVVITNVRDVLDGIFANMGGDVADTITRLKQTIPD